MAWARKNVGAMREAPRDEDGYMQRVPFVARQFGFLRPASRHVRLIVERLRATLQTRLPLPPAAPQLAAEIELEGSPGSERTLPTDCAPSDRVSTTSPGGSAATTKVILNGVRGATSCSIETMTQTLNFLKHIQTVCYGENYQLQSITCTWYRKPAVGHFL